MRYDVLKMQKIIRAFFLGLFWLLPLAACNGLQVEKTALQENPPRPPVDSRPAPIGFQEIRFAVPTGTPTVSQSPKGVLGLLDCEWPYTQVQSGIRGRSFPDDNFKQIFLNTLKGQGYDVTGNPSRFFDELEDEMRTVYAIGGEITDIKMDVCKQSNIWGIDRGHKGEGSVTINWSVFDTLKRRHIYKTTTKGYANLHSANQEGVQLLFENAIEAAIHNLGADKDFYNLVFFGETPEVVPETFEDPYDSPVRLFDPQEALGVNTSVLSLASAKDRLEKIRNVAVLIKPGVGHGSGFFVSPQGHILTNAHVVGNAPRVRVTTSGKRAAIMAEVLRVDRLRDVALLKLEEMPDGLNITTLPIRTDKPKIGEDVYAVGAPALRRLQDTVTKGIISAHRTDRREKQDYIQADVYVYSGNSGGPLLDANGNIIGMTVSGWRSGEQDLGGLNNFIPIADALGKLNIDAN